ncbi:MAG TPA: alpha/beta fold hydrolase [Longimicrobium sp.]|nr:alpha/beta fold hydrolase [Longimicrobium sp.]
MRFTLSAAARGACFLALAASLAACSGDSTGSGGPAVTGPGDYALSLRSDGRTRVYSLHVPPQFNGTAALPLVIAFHGVPGSPAQMKLISDFDAVANQRGFLVAYPAAATGDWDLNCGGCTEAEQRGVDDVRFVRELIDALVVQAKAGASRVYAAGFSQGALVTHHLACELNDRIAAFASVAATMLDPTARECQPSGGAPIAFFHGTADAEFPPGGTTVSGLSSLSIDRSVQQFTSANGCAGPPVLTNLPDAQADGTTVRRERWTGCATGADVILYRITGGGHTWPGSPAEFNPALGAKSRDIVASELIADFFLAN